MATKTIIYQREATPAEIEKAIKYIVKMHARKISKSIIVECEAHFLFTMQNDLLQVCRINISIAELTKCVLAMKKELLKTKELGLDCRKSFY